MGNRCLIIYASRTGNTAKVAERIKTTFERNGWQCDSFNIDKKTDAMNPPFDFKNYDFVCAGTGLYMHSPYDEILYLIRTKFFGIDPRQMGRVENRRPAESSQEAPDFHKKIMLGPGSKSSIVFATYAGFEFGPAEAEPAMALLALELAHLQFRCLGHISCPGRFLKSATPTTYHGDTRNRPNEKDLLKVEIFIEEKLEEIAQRPA
jgi:hypothetical protein